MQNVIYPFKNLTLLIGQFMVLLMGGWYVIYVYQLNISPDKNAAAVFQPTDCFLISKKLSTKGRAASLYRADFLISYNVNNVQYNRWVSGNGMDMAFSADKKAQEVVLADYAVGKTYACWYDPNESQIAFLVARHNWLAAFGLLPGAVIFVFALYGLLSHLHSCYLR